MDYGDDFGISVTNLGDLNGDNVTDLAVGAERDDDGGSNRGAVWVLFLDSDGTVRSHQKISNTMGGFTGALDDYDEFGVSVACLGDLNGDNVTDLAVGAELDDDGGTDQGAVYLLFMKSDGTLVPVELLGFSALATNASITLSWSTATETENLGFHIYRSITKDGEYMKITQDLIPGCGSSGEAHTYSYIDRNVIPGNSYFYKLADVDFSGNMKFHGPISVTVEAVPTNYSLGHNYPNPFNPSTTIRFELPKSSQVKLEIYNILGEKIRTLFNGNKEAGIYELTWDGKNKDGLTVPSSVYLYILTTNEHREVKKMILAK